MTRMANFARRAGKTEVTESAEKHRNVNNSIDANWLKWT